MKFEINKPDYYSDYDINTFFSIANLQQKITKGFVDVDLLDAAVFWFTNIERRKHNLKQFEFHDKLRQTAILHSEQMKRHNFFSHENAFDTRYKTLTNRINSVKDNNFQGFMAWGENISDYPVIEVGSFTIENRGGVIRLFSTNGKELFPYSYYEYAKVVVDGWMNSPGHRANILNSDYEYLGCGCAMYEKQSNGYSTLYFKLTQNFGGTLIDSEKNNPKLLKSLSFGKNNKFNCLFGGLGQKNKNNMNYSTQWSSDTPGYIIFLIDQSGSMNEEYLEKENKADFTAKVVNNTIQGLIRKNSDGKIVKNRISISLIGYGGKGGDSVEDIYGGDSDDYPKLSLLDEFAKQPLNKELVDVYAGYGRTVKEAIMSWIKPTSNGLTPMAEALILAKSKIEDWMSTHPDNPAPVIINISDGLPYDHRENEEVAKSDAIKVAVGIMSLEFKDGHPLIFNAHIGSDEKKKYTCPISEVGLDAQAKFLYEISSKIPAKYYNNYAEGKTNEELAKSSIQPDSKAFVSNADPVTFIKFIDFGSSGGGTDLKDKNV